MFSIQESSRCGAGGSDQRCDESVLALPLVPLNEPAVLDLEWSGFPGLSHQGNQPVPRLDLLEQLLLPDRHASLLLMK